MPNAKSISAFMVLISLVFSLSANTPNGNSLVKEPQPLNLYAVANLIGYPAQAYNLGLEGILPVRVLINDKGKVISHEYVTKEAKYFKEAIDPHIKKLRFKSAKYGDRAMKSWITIHFEFKLTD